ncbi:BTB/POZ and MATH domain-containing protein 2-like [Dorcoceras hygrometricum]|uniref:BTB/POZ and MATH domain-containing protein 2-like n=1 Tax=Dorcoceras hygrometricum TaxID=472368 RepID=A0A2Z7BGC8_9LAMI|nr:BTB/POZ and MATH domain-containing protein 2-like [Dorcoceras hygrometricum]
MPNPKLPTSTSQLSKSAYYPVELYNCPDMSHLSYTHSYSSILRQGLAAGDTPDVPEYHIGTREPSNILQILTYTKGSEALPDDLSRELGKFLEEKIMAPRVQ